jgi:hypothetical protein
VSQVKLGVLAIVVALLFGVMFSGWATWEARQSEQFLATLRTANGTIVSSGVTKRILATGAHGVGHANQPYWVLDLTYDYEVGGTRYTGHRYSNALTRESASLGQKASAKLAALATMYSPGTPVVVHYRPDDPAQSFLVVDLSASRVFGWATAILALGLLLSSVAYMVLPRVQ